MGNETEGFVEGPCTFRVDGRDFTEGGSWVVGDKAMAYIDWEKGLVTTWHGDTLGFVLTKRLGSWRYGNARGDLCHPYRLAYVRVQINGEEWWGRYNFDAGQVCRLRKVKRGAE